jgi:hypothetical protein
MGNEIILPKAEGNVWLEFRIGDWDPADTGKQLKAYQVTLDSSGYSSGSAGTLSAKSLPCTAGDNSTCEAAFGIGAACDFPAGCAVGCRCTPGFLNTARGGDNPFVFTVANLCGVDVSTPDIRMGCSALTSTNQNDPSPFPPQGLYAGELVLDVPPDARGTFTIGMKVNPDSALVDQNNLFFDLVGLVPAEITVQTGSCCYNIGPGTSQCDDGLLFNECAAHSTTNVVVYTPGGSCLGDVDGDGDDDSCPACRSDADCSDGLFCKDDHCDTATGVCSYTDHDCADTLGCTNDSCNEDTNVCDHIAVVCDDTLGCTSDACVEGGGCSGTACCVFTAADPDDGNPCTVDACNEPAGNITNTPVGDYLCVDSSECLAQTGSAFDCIQGRCFCTVAPVCELTIDPSSKLNPNCYDEGDKITVTLSLGPAANIINGVQIVIGYDPSCLKFNSIVPAGAVIPGNPYVTEIDELVDQVSGLIFYAVGVNPFGGVGTRGNSALAVISFTKIGLCNACNVSCGGPGFGGNPFDSTAVDSTGQPLGIEAGKSKDILDNPSVSLTVPDDVKVNADCDFPTAIVTWATPSASSNCPYGVNLTYSGSHESGYQYPPSVAANGGEFPNGTSTFCATATEKACGHSAQDCWTVEVNSQTTLDVTVQLSPIVAGELDRCIIFQLYSDCVQAPLEFCKTLHFGGLFDHVGHFTDDIKIPAKGQWICITAQDQLHSIRSCDFLECVDGDYIAVFKGDPFFGGNWLIQGNLDGWKKFNPNASHNVIDIYDFGQFVANYSRVLNPNTPCSPLGCHDTPAAHADINGDGVVNALDYAFIIRNYLASSKDCCCPGSVAGNTVPRTEITVQELRDLDMADLVVADLNNDGLVNADDMQSFMAGEVPTKNGNRGRNSGIRSSKK